jgi:hypothetical protein
MMGDRGIVIEYVRSCTAGSLGMSDCGPVWQLGVIAGLLVLAISTLVVLRLRAVAARSGENG